MLVLTVINLVFDIFYLFFIIRVFLIYMPQNKYFRLLKPVFVCTEPFLSVIRNGVPPAAIGFDAAPFIVIVLLYLLQQVIIRLIMLF